MLEPTRKTIVVDIIFLCEGCGCEWPDVVLEGDLTSIVCPHADDPGHLSPSRVFVGTRQAEIAFVEPSVPVNP